MNHDSRQGENEELPHDVGRLLQAARASVDAWKLFQSPYRVAPGLDSVFRVGFPLAAHALNNVQVALEIWDRFPWVAAANGRVAFEHAVVAQWLFLTPDGPPRFEQHIAHSNLVQAQELAALIEKEPELAALVTAEDLLAFQQIAGQTQSPGSQRSWSLPNLFAPFDSSGLLYGSYRSLSAAVHPSANTLGAHFIVAGDDILRVQREGAGISDRHEPAQGLALAGLWALNFIEKCRPEYKPPGGAGGIALGSNLPYDLAYSDSRRGQPGAS